jgi:hypothetical protein
MIAHDVSTTLPPTLGDLPGHPQALRSPAPDQGTHRLAVLLGRRPDPDDDDDPPPKAPRVFPGL